MLISVKAAAISVLAALTANAAALSSDPRNFFLTFGDSWTKTGFDPTGAVPNAQNPIGNPAMPGVTSAGGANWIGYMAAEYNASLAQAPNTQTVVYNFARGGATAKSSVVHATGPDFVSQVDTFTRYYSKGPKNRGWVTGNAVVGVWFGVNEIRKSYGNNTATLNVIFSSAMDAYFDRLQAMNSLGLMKFLLISAPPMNILPDFLKLSSQRAQQLRYAVDTWNTMLQDRASSFKLKNPGAVVEVLDASGPPMRAAVRDPSMYGASNASCTNKNGVSCLWWDGLHPATKLMRAFAGEMAKVLQSSTFQCFPGACSQAKTLGIFKRHIRDIVEDKDDLEFEY